MTLWQEFCFQYTSILSALIPCTILTINHQHLQFSGVRIGTDLKLFDMLATSDKPLSLDDLGKATKADLLLLCKSLRLSSECYQHAIRTDSFDLARLLQHLASLGMIREVTEGNFGANNVTHALVKPGNQAAIHH